MCNRKLFGKSTGIMGVFVMALCIAFMQNPAICSSAVAAADSAVTAGAGTDKAFGDLTGHWSENALRPLIERKILQGCNVNGVMRAMPEKSITRAELVAIIVRSFGLKLDGKNVIKLKDVEMGKWYSECIDIGTSNKIIEGYTDGSFRPDRPVTNEHVALILTRLKNTLAKKAGSTAVVDDKWFGNNVIDVLRDKLVSVPGDAYTAKNNATRAEAMAALSRFMEIIDNNHKIPSPSITPEQPLTPSPVPTAAPSGSDPASIIPAAVTPVPPAPPAPPATPTEPAQPPAAVPGVQGYKITAAPGELVYYQVYAYGLTELGGFDFKILYDPAKVVATSVRNGVIKEADYIGSADLTQAASGIIRIGSANTSPIVQKDGTLFTIVFRVQPGSAAGSAEISMESGDSSAPKLFREDGKLISPITNTNGVITIR